MREAGGEQAERMKERGCLSAWCLSACEYPALPVMNGAVGLV